MKFFKRLLLIWVVWVPVLIILSFAGSAFQKIGDAGNYILGLAMSTEPANTALGVLTIFGLITIVSFLILIPVKKSETWKNLSENPVFEMVFDFKGLLDKLSKLTPCIYPESLTVNALAWIHPEDTDASVGDNGEKINGSVQFSDPLVGRTGLLNKKDVILLGNTSKEVALVKFSRGLKKIDPKYLPWPGETEKNFRERLENILEGKVFKII